MNRRLLPTVLKLNALSSAATGVLLVALAAPLAGLLGLSSTFLMVAGLALLPFSAGVLLAARAPTPTRVKLVSAVDFTWVAGSVAVVALMPVTTLGIAAVLAIALVVDIFGTLQLLGLRDARAAA